MNESRARHSIVFSKSERFFSRERRPAYRRSFICFCGRTGANNDNKCWRVALFRKLGPKPPTSTPIGPTRQGRCGEPERASRSSPAVYFEFEIYPSKRGAKILDMYQRARRCPQGFSVRKAETLSSMRSQLRAITAAGLTPSIQFLRITLGKNERVYLSQTSTRSGFSSCRISRRRERYGKA